MKTTAVKPQALNDSQSFFGTNATEKIDGSGDKERNFSDSVHNFNMSNISIIPKSTNVAQPKLKINAPNDKYEREADAMADRIMRMPNSTVQDQAGSRAISTKSSSIQRKCSNCEDEELIQTKSLGNSPQFINSALSNQIRNSRGSGVSMDKNTLSFMSSRFGHDFNGVRIHNDTKASQLSQKINAKAFTVGNDIFFNSGQYTPNSNSGKQLLAHELTHVVQQGGGLDSQRSTPNSQVRGPIIQRALNKELTKIEELLSYGFLDWAIRDKEAIEALDILMSLPKYQQAVFFSDKKYVERLRSNIPDERKADFESLEAAIIPFEADHDIIESLKAKLSYGVFDWVITDKEAEDSLDMLLKLSSDKQAVAIGAIDYSRLLDNLPTARKPEMIDLLAKHLKTGGSKDTDEKKYPGTVLNSLKFTSDHQNSGNNMMKDNNSSWTSSGAPISQPEWSSQGTNNPISHTKDKKIGIDLNLNIAPEAASQGNVKITGDSDVGYLSFDYTGSMKGGLNQSVSMQSVGKLPNEITHIKDKKITWTMEWNNWSRTIGTTGLHEIFVTMGTPRRTDQVTLRRMALSVKLGKEAATLDTHNLVLHIMEKWPIYNLSVYYTNAWLIAENMKKGADCGTISRFVLGIIETLGIPGTASAVAVYANPSNPSVALEDSLNSLGSVALRKYPGKIINGNPARVSLIDGNECSNVYEAALKFNDGSKTEYYPGGVPFWTTVGGAKRRVKYPTNHVVLNIFNSLAWLSYTKEGGKVEEVYNYPKIPQLPFGKTKHKVGDILKCK